MQAGIAIRRIGHDASAALRHRVTSKEIDARGAEPAVGDIGRDHLVAMSGRARWTWRRRRSSKAPISGRESGCAGAAPRSPRPASHRSHRPRAGRPTHELAGLALRAPGSRGRGGSARGSSPSSGRPNCDTLTGAASHWRRVMVTLAAKARLRLRGLVAVRIAEAVVVATASSQARPEGR